MTGPQDSVIGIKKEVSIKRFLTQRSERFVVDRGESGFRG
ncbi:hypothetical protein E3J84_04415 [Candidatus Aerophobetes bacterium]|uniref:Uncharacterized protein n=1 Tax=Aerophobetes bacterium TaxID=2030807 RepID=A0A523RWH6_UNCAE|nr:MAG: hypothetical protein E3J84_04415 [Candidatus Aerophobetes bacterium]